MTFKKVLPITENGKLETENDKPETKAAWLWAVPVENYAVYVKTGTFAIRKVGRQALVSGWACRGELVSEYRISK